MDKGDENVDSRHPVDDFGIKRRSRVIDPLVEDCADRLDRATTSLCSAVAQSEWTAAFRAIVVACRATQSLRLDVGPLNRLDTDSRRVFRSGVTKFISVTAKDRALLARKLPERKDAIDAALLNIKFRLEESAKTTLGKQHGLYDDFLVD